MITLDERVDRLERALIGFVAIATGQLQPLCTEKEFKSAQQQLAQDLTDIRDGLK